MLFADFDNFPIRIVNKLSDYYVFPQQYLSPVINAFVFYKH